MTAIYWFMELSPVGLPPGVRFVRSRARRLMAASEQTVELVSRKEIGEQRKRQPASGGEFASYFKFQYLTFVTPSHKLVLVNTSKGARRMQKTMNEAKLGGQFTFPGTSLMVQRIGYGAMQLAGPGVWGPPKDHDGAIAVLREAIAAGVNHIDTADFYGPHVTNQIIREALHPYPSELVIVTKLGARRPPDKSWQPAISPQDLTAGVHDNLRNLRLDALDIVNYRTMGAIHGPAEGSIAEQVTVLADLRRKGLIRHIGLSNVTAAQLAEAQAITNSEGYGCSASRMIWLVTCGP